VKPVSTSKPKTLPSPDDTTSAEPANATEPEVRCSDGPGNARVQQPLPAFREVEPGQQRQQQRRQRQDVLQFGDPRHGFDHRAAHLVGDEPVLLLGREALEDAEKRELCGLHLAEAAKRFGRERVGDKHAVPAALSSDIRRSSDSRIASTTLVTRGSIRRSGEPVSAPPTCSRSAAPPT